MASTGPSGSSAPAETSAPSRAARTESGVAVDFFGDTARMPAGPALLAQQTGAYLLPVTLWYDETKAMRGCVHEEILVPEEGSRREKAAAMTGPASGPRPASSIPAMNVTPLDQRCFSNLRPQGIFGGGFSILRFFFHRHGLLALTVTQVIEL